MENKSISEGAYYLMKNLIKNAAELEGFAIDMGVAKAAIDLVNRLEKEMQDLNRGNGASQEASKESK